MKVQARNRPVTWFMSSKSSKPDQETKRPTSLGLFRTWNQELNNEGDISHGDEAITELFARLMDLPPMKKGIYVVSEVYLEPSRTATMELSRENNLVANSRSLFSQKSSIVDVRHGSKNASELYLFFSEH